MAEKLIKTKIALKQDTYEYWTDNTVTPPAEKKAGAGAGKYYVPLFGEVCFCEITAVNQGTQTTPPTVLFKVGNGKDYFKDLNWASALAADVYDWAKKSLDEFTAWVAKAPKAVTLKVNNVDTQYTIEEAIKLVRNEIAAGGESAAITVADESTAGKIKYVAKQGGTDIVEAIEANAGIGIDIAVVSNVPTIKHQAKPTKGDTTAAADAETDTATGNTFITEVAIDSLGHVAGVKSKTVTIPDSPAITITDKTGTNDDDDTAYVVTNLVEGGTLGHEIEATYIAVPTKKYVDEQISATVASAVDYLGTVSAAANLGKNESGTTITVGKGDFYRASAAFDLGSEKVHVGDMLIAIVDNPGTTATNWDVGHLEIDTNEWATNSDTAAGYVAATGGTGNAGKVWKVGSDGKPAWLAESHHQAKNIVGASANAAANAAVAKATNSIYLNLIENNAVRSSHNIVGAGATKVYSDANGKVTIESENTWKALSASQDGYVSKDWYTDLYNFVNKWDVHASGTLNHSADGMNITIDTEEGIAISASNDTALLYPTFVRVGEAGKDITSLYKDKITHRSATTNTTYNYTLPLASGELVLAGQEDIVYILDCN